VRFTRQRYQSGSLTKEKRKAGPAVWIFRWRENTPDGRVNRKVVVGTVEQSPTKTAARKAAEPLRANAIADSTGGGNGFCSFVFPRGGSRVCKCLI